MGFEVIYQYHERLVEGGYDKEETKEMKRRIGDAYEDVALEKLASTVMAQLARRDIWVTNWDVYEYKKQKLNCRETKGGIVIKNKKFALDVEGSGGLLMSEVADVEIAANGAMVTTLMPGQMPHNHLSVPGQPQGMKRPIKWVVLDSDDRWLAQVKGRGLQLVPNKRYPVFQEMPDPRDKRVDKFGKPTLDRKMVYVMWDDKSREIQASADYFVPADLNLVGGSFNTSNDGPKLMFEAERNDEMVDIRARR